MSHWIATARFKLGSPRQGKAKHEDRIHGVGFAVRNTLLNMVTVSNSGTECLLSLCLNTTVGKVTIVSAYAPTLYSSQELKDEFYDALHKVIQTTPRHEQIILLGDFNARVGADYNNWSSCLGRFGVGKINENGQRLLELCSYNNQCVTNTFSKQSPSIKFLGDILDRNIGTSSTLLLFGVQT